MIKPEKKKELPSRCMTLALVGPAQGVNYGNAMTYYALYNTLRELGYDPLLVLPPLCGWWGKVTGWEHWREAPYCKSKIAPRFEHKQQIAEYFDKIGWYDLYLLGSDQLFRPEYIEGLERYSLLDWVPDSQVKSVYAASFGTEYLNCRKKVWQHMRKWIRRFDFFSVREKSGVALCRDYFGIKARWALDPCFLCDVKHYDQLAERSPVKSGGITTYILDTCEEKSNIVALFAKQLGMSIFEIKADCGGSFHIEDWVKAIRDADYLVTDSFHGACFAVIYHVPFTLIRNKDRGSSRVYSFLELTGLWNCTIDDYCTIAWEDLRTSVINWDEVDARLSAARKESFSILQQALTPNKTPRRSLFRRIADRLTLCKIDILWPSHPGRCSKLRKFLMKLIPIPSVRRRWREKYLKPKTH